MSGYQKANEISWTELEGKTVILDTREGRQFHEFDEVASFLWALLDHCKSLDELVERLTDEYDIHIDQAKLDIENFLKTLREKKLIL